MVHPQVASDAQRAADMFTGLMAPDYTGPLPAGTERMGKEEVKKCSGLAFCFVKKVAMGLTATGGHGFVIRQTATGWSAPFYVKVHSAGVGLSLGYSELDGVTIMNSPAAVAAFAAGQWSVDTDMGANVGGAVGKPAGGHVGVTSANLSDPKLTYDSFTYTVAKGAMIDFSWVGVHYTPDAETNAALYGAEGATPEAVLEGGAAPPEGMAPLYAALTKELGA